MFNLHKKLITSFLEEYLLKKENSLKGINRWNKIISGKLLPFIKNGKMIRGSLVLQSFLFFNNKISEDAIKVSAAIEIIHSALLIHDDIMDQDKFRRGGKTISSQFTDLGKEQNFINSQHFGNSMGISVGDLGFFLGFELLSQIKEISDNKINEFVSGELSKVTLAQMQDVYGGYTKEEFSKEEILSLYKHKTGRYSLSIPLMLGVILTGKSENSISILEKMGENLGILFQIKDDELNLFGEKNETGKPVGSDIRENKKTLFRYFLYQLSSEEQKEKLNSIFGNSDISKKQIKYVLDSAEELKIREKINEITNQLEQKTKDYLKDLDLPGNKNRAFLEFLDYNLKRKK